MGLQWDETKIENVTDMVLIFSTPNTRVKTLVTAETLHIKVLNLLQLGLN